MQASFTDLVGTTVVSAHCFDSAELTNLTPALDITAAERDMVDEASGAIATASNMTCSPGCGL